MISLDGPSQSSVKKTGAFGLFSAIFAFAFNMATAAVTAIKVFSDFWSIVINIAAPIPVFYNHCAIIYTFYYVIVLTMLREKERQTLTRMMKEKTKAKRMLGLLDDMMHDRREFEELFNETPFICIAFLFTQVPAAVINITGARGSISYGNKSNWVVMYLLANIVNVMLNVWIVKSVCRIQSQSRALMEELKRKLYQEHTDMNDTFTENLALNEAQQAFLQFNFTGWGLFSINRSLLLAVLSPLISFSVLTLQLFASV